MCYNYMSLLKTGCVGLDMSGIGISKVERNLKQANPNLDFNWTMGTIMLFLPCF